MFQLETFFGGNGSPTKYQEVEEKHHFFLPGTKLAQLRFFFTPEKLTTGFPK